VELESFLVRLEDATGDVPGGRARTG
jgi:hypothetical protein